MKKNINLNILKKNINNKHKLVLFNKKRSDLKETKYYPPYFNEWKNTVYFYNKNKIKDTAINNININKLIKSYFNLFFKNNKFLKSKYIHRKKIRHLLKKIYVSKATIKYTNNRAIVTLYTVNIGKKALYKKYKKLLKYILLKKERWERNKNKTDSILEYFVRKLKFITKIIDKKIIIISKQNNKLNVNLFKDILINKLTLLNKRLFYYNMFIEIWLIKAIKYIFYRDLILLRKYQFSYLINEFKFRKKFFLVKLSNKLSQIINKKVEFNLINLKSIVYNTDIFTSALALKLKRQKSNVLKNIITIINRGKLPKINRRLEIAKLNRNINKNLFENKYKNLNLFSIFKNEYKNLNEFLKKTYPNNILIKKTQLNKSGIWDSTYRMKYFKYKRANIIFHSIKYKNMGGIRLEVKGRLSKRNRADRALFKIRLKGGLKNIYSSYKRLSSVDFRGYAKANVEYSIYSSKRKIGAFAVKGWISGK